MLSKYKFELFSLKKEARNFRGKKEKSYRVRILF